LFAEGGEAGAADGFGGCDDVVDRNCGRRREYAVVEGLPYFVLETEELG
jgi:hypothetical protein